MKRSYVLACVVVLCLSCDGAHRGVSESKQALTTDAAVDAGIDAGEGDNRIDAAQATMSLMA